MSRILVLAQGAPIYGVDSGEGTAAVVVHDMGDACVSLTAHMLMLPTKTAADVFRTSPQAIRYSATRLAVREAGKILYEPLSPEWLMCSNWIIGRKNPPALVTAYVLARAHDAEFIECRLPRKGVELRVSDELRRVLTSCGITLRYLS